jgi:DNA-binding NarL/FixJ family response regulator
LAFPLHVASASRDVRTILRMRYSSAPLAAPDSDQPVTIILTAGVAFTYGSVQQLELLTVTVVFVDDHEAVREALGRLLEREGFSFVGGASTVARGWELIDETRPTVAVVDIGLPDGSGIDLAQRVSAASIPTAVLLYTGGDPAEHLVDAVDCGAEGFALKVGPSAELITAVRTLAAGGTYLDPRLAALLHSRRGSPTELRPREREILDLVARGLPSEDIAAKLFISTETVRTHVRNLMKRMGAHSRAHAVALAISAGEIHPDRPELAHS